MGADLVSLSLCFEELSRAWMGIAGFIGSHSLACWMIARGTDEQKNRLLPDIGDEQDAQYALTEPGAGSDLSMATRANARRRRPRGSRSTKMWITNARGSVTRLV